MFRRTPAFQLKAVAFAVIASVLFVLALAANPHWHEEVHHHDADESHEVCVVDLFTAGTIESVTSAPIALIGPVYIEISLPVAIVDVPSVFLAGAILEHAPPVRA